MADFQENFIQVCVHRCSEHLMAFDIPLPFWLHFDFTLITHRIQVNLSRFLRFLDFSHDFIFVGYFKSSFCWIAARS